MSMLSLLPATDSDLAATAGGPYRRVLPFTLPTGGAADDIAIDGGKTNLSLLFSTRDYDATADTGPVSIQALEVRGQDLVVSLDAPRGIRRVRVQDQPLSDLTAALRAIERSVMHYDWGSATMHQSISAAAVAAAGAMSYSHDQLVERAHRDYGRGLTWGIPAMTLGLHRVDGEAIADEPTVTIANGGTPAETFAAGRFAIRAQDAGGDPLALSADLLAELIVEGVPSAPRVGLALDAAETPEFFLTLPGEVRDPAAWDGINAKAGQELAKILARRLQHLVKDLQTAAPEAPAPLPDPLRPVLVAESDAPCRFHLAEFAVAYDLRRGRACLADQDGKLLSKTVLRFDGQGLASRTLALDLPAGIGITGARLEIDTSFGSARQGLAGPEPASLEDVAPTGAAIETDRWATQGLVLDAGRRITDIAIAVLSLAPAGGLEVTIETDQDDAPSGHQIAAGGITPATIGRRRWMLLRLPEPVVLQAGTCWVGVRAAKGRALWLTGPAGDAPLCLYHRVDGNPAGPPTLVRDQAARVLLLSRTSAADGAGPVRLAIGDQTITPNETNGDKVVYELAPAIATVLGNPTTAATIQLNFSSALAGQITVYPPRVRYEVNGSHRRPP